MNTLLDIKDLCVNFCQRGQVFEAVRGADLKIHQGEILGLVGESGSGKTVTALSITRLLPESGRISGGQIIFDGHNLLELTENELRRIRGRKISYIFQDPATSLNPVFTIGEQLIEAIAIHPALLRIEQSFMTQKGGVHQKGIKKEGLFDKAILALRDVGMPSPKDIMYAYPHQLSGGMKQRIMIAMAISCHPKLLVADEPTTALDVTIQAQILDLLIRLKDELQLTVLLITHDLSVVAQVANKTAVMQSGKIVEYGDTEIICRKPSHLYTKRLIDCIPILHR